MCGGGRAVSGDCPKRGHRVESIPYYVEDNDPVVGAQEMRDHPRTHVRPPGKTITIELGRLVAQPGHMQHVAQVVIWPGQVCRVKD